MLDLIVAVVVIVTGLVGVDGLLADGLEIAAEAEMMRVVVEAFAEEPVVYLHSFAAAVIEIVVVMVVVVVECPSF